MMLDIFRKFKKWGANSTRSNSFHPNPALHPCDICTHLETDKKNENTNSLACTAYNSTNNGWMAEKMRVIRALADPDRRDLCPTAAKATARCKLRKQGWNWKVARDRRTADSSGDQRARVSCSTPFVFCPIIQRLLALRPA